MLGVSIVSYTVRSSEKTRKSGADGETKALLYLGLSQILCKHRRAVQNRAKFLVGGGGETATTCQQYKQETGCMSRAAA